MAGLRIAADHAAFAGHFPGFPILPGAALLDEVLHQIVRSHELDLLAWRLSNVKFLGAVKPGDTLDLEHVRTDANTIRFTVKSAAGLVASGILNGN